MLRRLLICLIAVFLGGMMAAQGAEFHPSKPGFLDRRGTELLLDGKPFRSVSVNKFDLFLHFLKGGDVEKQEVQYLKDISGHGFRVVRFAAVGFWPRDMENWANGDYYWNAMDRMMAAARENHIYLIPSIYWNCFLFTDMAGETMQDMLTNKDSKSRQYLDLYTYQIVSRYKDDRAVLFWELGNEFNLLADLTFMRPYGYSGLNAPALGASYMRVRRDDFTTEQLIPFVREYAQLIRSLDPNHLITSGYSAPRQSAQHLRTARGKGDWTIDLPGNARPTLEIRIPIRSTSSPFTSTRGRESQLWQ